MEKTEFQVRKAIMSDKVGEIHPAYFDYLEKVNSND